MCEEGSKRGGGSNAIPVYTASQIRGIREACRVRASFLTQADDGVVEFFGRRLCWKNAWRS